MTDLCIFLIAILILLYLYNKQKTESMGGGSVRNLMGPAELNGAFNE